MKEKDIDQSYKKILLVFAFASAIIFMNYASIEYVGKESYYWIEAENTDELYHDLHLMDDKDASGRKALVSNAESHSVNSYAVYNTNVDNDGKYQLWARLWASNACGNSYVVSMDQSNNSLVGNTDFMHAWHWVKGPSFQLTKGSHKLFLWNEEFGTRIDRFLLTTDPLYIPSGEGESNDFEITFEEKIPEFLVFSQEQAWKRKTVDGYFNIFLS
jgi:hypothetical protein